MTAEAGLKEANDWTSGGVIFRRPSAAAAAAASLLLLGVLAAGREPSEPAICVHPRRGQARPVSLGAVRRAQEEVGRRLAMIAGEAAGAWHDSPYDSGLPACRGRSRRIVRTEVPPALVGKTIVFAPDERMPPGDLRVATSARRLAGVKADALADAELARRLGVRCRPARVEVKSEVELEIVEDP